MKVSLPRAQFASNLDRIKEAVPSSSALTELKHVVLTAREDRTVLAHATNTVLHMRSATQAARVEQPGTIGLPAEILIPLVRSLDGDLVSIETDDETRIATLDCRGKHYAIHGVEPKAFPTMPVAAGENIVSFQVPAATLAAAIRNTVFCSMEDRTSSRLASVYFDLIEDDTLNVVGYNGSRLASQRIETPLHVGGAAIGAILPNMNAAKIEKALSGDKPATVSFTPTLFSVVCDDIEIVSRLYDGEYPQYRKVYELPEHAVATVKVGRNDMLAALDRLMLLPDGAALKLKRIDFRLEHGQPLAVSRVEAEVGDANEPVPSEVALVEPLRGKDPYEASYSGVYLRAALASLPEGDVDLTFAKVPGKAAKPILISSGDRYLVVAQMNV